MRGGSLFPRIGEKIILNNQLTEQGQVVVNTDLLSFHYRMRVHGLHQFVVYAKCQGLPHHVHLGQFSSVFSIGHFDSTTEKSGRLCVKLHDSLFDIFGYSTSTCAKFDVIIQAIALHSKICLKDFRFHSMAEFLAGGITAQFCSKTVWLLSSPAWFVLFFRFYWQHLI
jgi:hypothetical protein